MEFIFPPPVQLSLEPVGAPRRSFPLPDSGILKARNKQVLPDTTGLGSL